MKVKFSENSGAGLSAVLKAIRELANSEVLVGIPSDSEQPHLGNSPIGPEARTDTPNGIGNAALGYIHETGMPEQNIPARPFLAPGVEKVKVEITKRLKDAATAAMAGKKEVVQKNLHAVGLIAQASVRNTIAQGIPPPLSQRTVDARRRRTKGSSYRRKASGPASTTPLYDTGQLVQSISYVIRKKRS